MGVNSLLVLSRKPGESFVIGGEIEVKVLRIEGSEVKIGISAPSSVKVYRMEIYEKVVEENRRAALTQFVDLKGVLSDDKDKS